MDAGVKKPWLSKTILFGALTAILGGAAVFLPAAQSLADFLAAHAGEVGMVWGVLAIVLRLVTKDKIVLID